MAVASALKKSSESTYLDLHVINSLSSIMTGDAIQALLVDMERDVRLRLERLTEIQIASGSLTMIALDAHDLKSMGGNFGLSEMAHHAGIVENAARKKCIDTVRAGMAPLISVGERSLKELKMRPEFIRGAGT